MTNPAKTALARTSAARIAMTAISMIDFQGEKGIATKMTTIGNAFSFEGEKGKGMQVRLEVNPVNADRVGLFVEAGEHANVMEQFLGMPERLEIKSYRSWNDRSTGELRTIGTVLGRAVRVQTEKAIGYVLYFKHLPANANAQGVYEIALVEPLPEEIRKARQAERQAAEVKAA